MTRTGRWGLRATLVLTCILMVVPTAAARGATAAASVPGTWHSAAVRFEPLDPSVTIAVAGVGEYRGAVEVVRTAAGLGAVNEVGLEQYLLGVSEVPPSWPIEAQKAQAVAARTYALYEREGTRPAAYREAGADICATEACQVYLGVRGERRQGAARWAEAVRATAGQALLHGDRPIRAKYSASNGGQSVAGGAPYLRAAPDPHDAAVSPYTRWRWALSLEQLAALFPADGALVSVWSAPAGVVLGRHHPDGTASQQVVPRWDFRSVLNARLAAPAGLPRPVPAPMFDARTEGDGVVVIEGRGYGHGVGLSQYGAMGKARHGWDHAQILAAYYGGLEPVVLPAERVPERLRVAVALDLAAASVSASGPVRVVAADGTPLAHLTSGAWRVRAIPQGVEVLAPEAERGHMALDVLGVALPDDPGGEAVLRFDLSVPAFVRVGVEGADRTPDDVGLLTAGEHALPVPVPAGGGTLVLHADAGGGRTASVPVAVAAAPATRQPGPEEVRAAATPASGPFRTPFAAVAGVLALTAGAAGVTRIGTLRWSRRPAGP